MDPSESGEGNHWRINLHFRAITVGGDSVIDHSTDGDDFCLLVSPYLSSDGSFQDEGKKGRDSSKHCSSTKDKQSGLFLNVGHKRIAGYQRRSVVVLIV